MRVNTHVPKIVEDEDEKNHAQEEYEKVNP